MQKTRKSAALILTCLSLTAAALAEKILRLDQPDLNAPAPGPSVFVRDSAIATDKFELARRMERLKEWHKSADVYQEILDKYRDPVVPTLTDEKGNPRVYSSVTLAVQERLCRWPEDGLTVYRTRFEPAAAALLEQARRGDFAAYHTILARYFVTDSAKHAAIRLMDMYLESGEFPAAAWIGDRLLQWHPNLAAERPAVLFRTATAYHLAGMLDLAAKRAQELRSNYPNELGTVAGADVKLIDALDRQLAHKPPTAVNSQAASWTTFGGNETRNLIYAASARPGTRVYSVPLPLPTPPNLPEPQKKAWQAQIEAARKSGVTINIFPVVDRGQLFFQDGQRIWALHLESGTALPGWMQTYPQNQGQYRATVTSVLPEGVVNMSDQWIGMGLAQPRQHTLTLTDDAVLAVLGSAETRMIRINMGMPAAEGMGTKLICLNRETGRQRWVADPASIPNNPGNAKNLAFSGSPLVVGDNIYVIARGSTGAGTEDCYVICFARDTGLQKWACYIASAQRGMNMGGMVMPASGGTLSHLAFANGRVYVLTNLGALAAVDAYSGTTAWLAIYPRDPDIMPRNRAMIWGGGIPVATQDRLKAWQMNPVIVQEGKLFILPSDAEHLFVMDAGSGQEIARIETKIEFTSGEGHAPRTTELNMLVGVIGDCVYVSGKDSVAGAGSSDSFYVLDWAKAATRKPGKPRLPDGCVHYTVPLPIVGRPFLTTGFAFIPGASTLSVFDMSHKRIVEQYPRYGEAWPHDEGPGNVVVSGEHVIIAGANAVSVYTDLQGVRQKYQLAIQKDPSNVEARLIFSELMFNAREIAEARQTLDEAVEKLGGLGTMRPGPQRERIFSDCILFAQKLSSDRSESTLAQADHLFDIAAAAALTPSQQVNYRLSRARWIESLKGSPRTPDYVAAVRLYQEILSDPSMRIITLAAQGGGGSQQAGKVAEAAIDDLVRRQNPTLYDPFAQQAQEKLSQLTAAGTPDQLLALADSYPNAVSIASAAMLKAAADYEKAGNWRMAGQVLKSVYWRYATRLKDDEKTLVMQSLARNLLRSDNLAAAAKQLRKLSPAADAKLAAPMVLPDGKPLAAATVREAAVLIDRALMERSTRPLPAVRLPRPLTTEERLARKPQPIPFAKPRPDSIVDNIQAIAEADDDQPAGTRPDRLVVWSDAKLACYAPGQTTPLWRSGALSESPAALYWSKRNLLVWSGGDAALLDGQKGEQIWRVQLPSLPPVELVPGGADESPIAAAPAADPVDDVRILGGGRVFLRGGRAIVAQGGVVAVNPAMPAGAAPMPPPDDAAPADGRERITHLRVLSDRLIISTTTGRVLAARRDTGQLLWQTRLASGPTIQRLLANDDFTVACLADGSTVQLLVLDSFDGQQILRKKFSTGQNTWAINCALSPDGTLIWTTPTSIAAKDLYEPGPQPTWEKSGKSYVGLTRPQQVVVVGQQVLAVCDGGRFIERRHLRTGEPAGNPIGVNRQDDRPAKPDIATRISVAGMRAFVLSSDAMLVYCVDSDGVTEATMNEGVAPSAADALITQDYVFLPGIVVNPDDADGKTSYTIRAYSRATVTSVGVKVESLNQPYKHDLVEPSKVKAWHAVDGGIYYLSGDDKLHWMPAAGPTN